MSIFRYLWILVLLGLSSCGGSDSSSGIYKVDFSQQSSGEVTRDAGGVVEVETESGIARLTVPPNALGADVTITMAPVLQLGAAGIDDEMLVAVDLQPKGLRFLKSAVLELILPPDSTGPFYGFTFEGRGENIALHPSRVVGNTVTIELQHFSGAGVGSGDGSTVPPASFAEAQANAALARALTQSDELAAFRRWYQAVIADLDIAIANPGSFLEIAISRYLSWRAQVQSYAYEEELVTEFNDANSKAAQAYFASIEAYNQICRSQTSLTAALDAVILSQEAESLGLDGIDERIGVSAVIENLCATVTLDSVTLLPSTIEVDESATLRVTASALIDGRFVPDAEINIFAISPSYLTPNKGTIKSGDQFSSTGGLAGPNGVNQNLDVRVIAELRKVLGVRDEAFVRSSGGKTLVAGGKLLEENVSEIRDPIAMERGATINVVAILRQGETGIGNREIRFSTTSDATLTAVDTTNGHGEAFGRLTADGEDCGEIIINVSTVSSPILTDTVTVNVDCSVAPEIALLDWQLTSHPRSFGRLPSGTFVDDDPENVRLEPESGDSLPAMNQLSTMVSASDPDGSSVSASGTNDMQIEYSNPEPNSTVRIRVFGSQFSNASVSVANSGRAEAWTTQSDNATLKLEILSGAYDFVFSGTVAGTYSSSLSTQGSFLVRHSDGSIRHVIGMNEADKSPFRISGTFGVGEILFQATARSRAVDSSTEGTQNGPSDSLQYDAELILTPQ